MYLSNAMYKSRINQKQAINEFHAKDYNTFARILTPEWNRNDHQNRINYIGMLVSHWASRRDTGLKDRYLSGIPNYFLVAKNVWLVMSLPLCL